MDIVAKPTREGPMGTSLPGNVRRTHGGVGRNIAEALGRMGTPTHFVSAVGSDANGTALVAELEKRVTTECAILPNIPTATFLAVLDAEGNLVSAVADMKAFDHVPPPRHSAPLTIADGNLPPEILTSLPRPLWFEPVSVEKGVKVCGLPRVDLISPNYQEACAITGEVYERPSIEDAHRVARKLCDQVADVVVLTLGKQGVLVVSTTSLNDPKFAQYADGLASHIHVNRLESRAVHMEPKHPLEKVVSDTGAGDTLLACTAWGVTQKLDLLTSVALGMMGAVMTLGSSQAVHPGIASIQDMLPKERSKL